MRFGLLRLGIGLCGCLVAATLSEGAPSGSPAGEPSTPVPFERLMAEIRAQAARRRRVVPRTRVMPRSQLKYGPDRNYLLNWADRPLFVDRATRVDPLRLYCVAAPGLSREVGIVRRYGLDGLACLTVGAGQALNYRLATDLLPEFPEAEGFILCPEMSARGYDDAAFERYVSVVQQAVRSPHAWRRDGKVIVTSYVADAWPAGRLAEFLAALRARVGDTFLFVADIRGGTPVAEWQFGQLGAEAVEQERARLRGYLDVADGIMFMGANHISDYREDDPAYGLSLNDAFLSDYLAPLFRSVLAEPPYTNKLFGFSAAVAYINQRSGSCKRQDGTRALRRTFEAALAADPDFIGMPEWNEFNENTCVCPTLTRGLATQRLIRHYMRQLHGEPPAPEPDDDPSVPNLIVSYRRILKLGERLDIEVLRLPDGTRSAPCEAVFSLAGADGRILKTWDGLRFDEAGLQEHRLSIATETIGGETMLMPRLTVKGADGTWQDEGRLVPIRLQTSWNWDYLCVNQPLRDLYRPSLAELAIEPAAGKTPAARVRIAGNEELASVEILKQGEAVAAYDRDDEFGLASNMLFHVRFAVFRPMPIEGRLRVDGVSSIAARPDAVDAWDTSGEKPGIARCDREGTTVILGMEATRSWRGLFLTVPRKDLDSGSLDFDLNLGRFRVALADIARGGAWGKTLSGQRLVRVERCDHLMDLPVHVDALDVDASVLLPDWEPEALYSLRMITKRGRISHTVPKRLDDRPRSAAPAPLPVFSETRNAVVAARPGEPAVNLDYTFSRQGGDVLVCAAGRRWDGELGGGIVYGDPFCSDPRYPGGTNVFSAPAWVEEDGNTCLRFDGKWNYLTLPHEALPRGCFTLTLEIKPISVQTQVLFRAYGLGVGPFLLKLRGVRLEGFSFDDRKRMHALPTDLVVPTNQWSTVSVEHDLTEWRFRVGTRVCTLPAAPGPPAEYAPVVVGGFAKPGRGVEAGDRFFDGFLRRLTIRHR